MPADSQRVSPNLRQAVANRAQNYCEYCRCPEAFSPDRFTVDHIQPRQAGGKTALENLAWSCYGCNGRKFTRTHHVDPETEQMVALFNPRQQLWSDHFDWSEDGTQVIGKMPCGRATIDALDLNRQGVVNLRRLLASVGLHP
jgi:5-methylcytosine-specific restriction endonuclease McrA